MTRITWIASYPKSGNTWTRAFLTRYFQPEPTTADLPLLHRLIAPQRASSRACFDDMTGVSSSELGFEGIERYRRKLHDMLAANAESPGPNLLKTHDTFLNEANAPRFFAGSSEGAIVIVRNPLDIAVSFANHTGKTIDAIIDLMGRAETQIDRIEESGGPYLPQSIGSWSTNVRGWIDQRTLPIVLVRYEDMLANPLGEFSRMLTFLGVDVRNEKLSAAQNATQFMALKREEAEGGFLPMPEGRSFFRTGGSEDWRQALSNGQVLRLRQDHSEMMERLGYLS